MSRRSRRSPPGSRWVFGYGSLLWRPDFPYLERRRARLHGWQRRFWQGSHDHRGVPERPGRVVTLVETGDGHCDGMAYLVERDVATEVFERLDQREKNGYQRREVLLETSVRALESAPTDGLAAPTDGLAAPTDGLAATGAELAAAVYIAATDNFAYLGPAPLPEMVRQIVVSRGPSGANLDYLLELAAALRVLGADDPHVFELEAAARSHPS